MELGLPRVWAWVGGEKQRCGTAKGVSVGVGMGVGGEARMRYCQGCECGGGRECGCGERGKRYDTVWTGCGQGGGGECVRGGVRQWLC